MAEKRVKRTRRRSNKKKPYSHHKKLRTRKKVRKSKEVNGLKKIAKIEIMN